MFNCLHKNSAGKNTGLTVWFDLTPRWTLLDSVSTIICNANLRLAARLNTVSYITKIVHHNVFLKHFRQQISPAAESVFILTRPGLVFNSFLEFPEALICISSLDLNITLMRSRQCNSQSLKTLPKCKGANMDNKRKWGSDWFCWQPYGVAWSLIDFKLTSNKCSLDQSDCCTFWTSRPRASLFRSRPVTKISDGCGFYLNAVLNYIVTDFSNMFMPKKNNHESITSAAVILFNPYIAWFKLVCSKSKLVGCNHTWHRDSYATGVIACYWI